MRGTRYARFSLPLVAAALVGAACGGADPTGDPAPPATAGAPASEEPREDPLGPAPEPEPEPEPEPDNELRVNTSVWDTDFTKHTVPLGEIESGGPTKDGIPAIDTPTYTTVEEAWGWLEAREPVVEVEIAGSVRAYPLQILIWHEIVNDELGGTPVSVTFCPLCGTALAFDRRHGGMVLDFGTTGNLRNSDLVMYDRQTETWWQQFGGEGIVGELAGETLTPVPARIVAFEDYAARYPDGEVLSRDTGASRPYGENPYYGYDSVDTPPFFGAANLEDNRLPPKERVVLIDLEGDTVAVPFPALAEAGEVEVEVAGEPLVVSWIEGVRSALDNASIAHGREVGSAEVRDSEGNLVPFDTPFWFAVAAFRPEARIVTP